jgi:hypothetical protein
MPTPNLASANRAGGKDTGAHAPPPGAKRDKADQLRLFKD